MVCDVFVPWQALAGKVAVDYTNVEGDAEDGLLEDLSESGGLLTSAGVLDDHEEDLSVYGKAYEAFRKAKSSKEECKEACMALAALCEVASINTLLSNFIEPLQVHRSFFQVIINIKISLMYDSVSVAKDLVSLTWISNSWAYSFNASGICNNWGTVVLYIWMGIKSSVLKSNIVRC